MQIRFFKGGDKFHCLKTQTLEFLLLWILEIFFYSTLLNALIVKCICLILSVPSYPKLRIATKPNSFSIIASFQLNGDYSQLLFFSRALTMVPKELRIKVCG